MGEVLDVASREKEGDNSAGKGASYLRRLRTGNLGGISGKMNPSLFKRDQGFESLDSPVSSTPNSRQKPGEATDLTKLFKEP